MSEARHRPRRHVRAPILLSALAVAVAAVAGVAVRAVPATAAAADRAESLGLEAVAGIGGQLVPDTWTPVTVTLQPDQPLEGRIVLATTANGPATVTSLDVEVGAGVQKRYHLLAPPGGGLRVQVVDEVAGDVVTVQPRADRPTGFLVGVLGGIAPADVPPVTLPMTDQRVTVVHVDEGLLELGPRALHAASTLLVRQADLAGMPAPARDAVVAHVADGATLVVTAVTDPDLGLPWRTATAVDADGFTPAPGAWGARSADLALDAVGVRRPLTPTDVAAIAAGRGRLVTTTWDAGPSAPQQQAAWEPLLQPSTAGADGEQGNRWANLPHEVEQTFGASAGDPPSLGWMAGFLVVYVLVAGPVVGVVLSRRRRPELAWVVLPLVTALFAGAAFFGATGSRPRVGVSARVASWVDGAGTTLAVAGVRSPQTGQHTVVLPGAGWQLTNATWSGATRVARTEQQTTATVSLPSQAFGAVIATRPADGPPPLDVEVAVFADEARVEVTNLTDQPLDDPTLRLGTSTHPLAATLPAGETLVQTVPLPDGLPPQRDPFAMGFGPFDQGERGPDALATLVRWDVLTGAPGIAWVTATSPTSLGLPAPTVDGGAPVDHGTLLAVGVTPPVTDDTTTAFEVQRDLVATAGQTWREGPLTLAGSGPATLRFRLPQEARVTGLVLDLEPPRGGGVFQPEVIPAEDCGMLETRDAQTGDLLSSSDVCTNGLPPCPPDADACSWGQQQDGTAQGEACYPDRPCATLRWVVQTSQPEQPLPATGMQVWDHVDRRWADVAEVTDLADGRVGGDDVGRVLGPLGDVWVRATGELQPFDLGPQGVGAALGGQP